jgi:ribonuclease P protein component
MSMQGVTGDKYIKKVLTSKKKLRTTGLTVGCSNLELTTQNYLIIISKKVFKKANKRNKLRRRIKAILYTNREVLFGAYNSLLVQVQGKELLFINYTDLEKLILDSFYKLTHK